MQLHTAELGQSYWAVSSPVTFKKGEKKKKAVLRGCQIGLVSGPTVCAEVRVQTCLSQCSAPTHYPLPEELLHSVKFPSPPLVHEEQPDLPE